MAKIVIAGAGFSGLSAAAYLAGAGHEVHVFEKNASAGGRARQITTPSGYLFDMGPSWYWMPDVFERFFNDHGTSVADHYQLELLDPSFNIVFGNEQDLSVPADYKALRQRFEEIEAGSALRLDNFMEEAAFKYRKGMQELVYKPGRSITEFADPALIMDAMRLQLFSSFSKHARRYFSDPRLLALIEFPVLFLGAMPSETPALYSLMNYAGLKLGTWYPMGGFGEVVKAMQRVAEKNGAVFHFNAAVEEIEITGRQVSAITVNGERISCDAMVASADYHHAESLMPEQYRNYNEAYWQKKTFAPSCLIFYTGIKKRIKKLQHHTLFFDEDLNQHALEIYKDPEWPARPLFYACCPSKTDAAVAPEGHENLFLLMPIAPGLKDSPAIRDKYLRLMIARLESATGEKNLLDQIDYLKSYCVSDFVTDYNAYKGNAYGLANTLKQTAILKPKINNKKVRNLFYAGQLTVPGPGVPPALISGKLAAVELLKHLKEFKYEVVV